MSAANPFDHNVIFDEFDKGMRLLPRHRRHVRQLARQAMRETSDIDTEEAFEARFRELVKESRHPAGFIALTTRDEPKDQYGISVALIIMIVQIAVALYRYWKSRKASAQGNDDDTDLE